MCVCVISVSVCRVVCTIVIVYARCGEYYFNFYTDRGQSFRRLCGETGAAALIHTHCDSLAVAQRNRYVSTPADIVQNK